MNKELTLRIPAFDPEKEMLAVARKLREVAERSSLMTCVHVADEQYPSKACDLNPLL